MHGLHLSNENHRLVGEMERKSLPAGGTVTFSSRVTIPKTQSAGVSRMATVENWLSVK